VTTRAEHPPGLAEDARLAAGGADSLAHCAGVDLKTVQARLGHSSIALTADTYTSVLTDLIAYAAEATAKLVPAAAAARNPGPGPAETTFRRNPLGRPISTPQNGPWPGGPVATSAPSEAAHTRPTDVPQRSRAHSR
jgi:hypothetical protein